ncbi:MAG: hypothetical protein U0903_16050 [Planctomycetales bacterium]
MGTSRTITEKQHQNAKRLLEQQAEKLAKEGVEKQNFKRYPAWRTLDAKVRQLNARLRKIGEVEALDAELKQRKSEKAAAEE